MPNLRPGIANIDSIRSSLDLTIPVADLTMMDDGGQVILMRRRSCWDTTELRGRIANRVGLQDRWNKLHYSSTTQVSQGARDLVLQVIMSERQLGDLMNGRGRRALQRTPGLYEDIESSIDVDFDQSILIWHVITDVYLCCREPAADDLLAETVKEVSDYMMFLYVVQPHMLPGPVRGSRYGNNCDGLLTLWRQRSAELQERDDYSARTPREHLARLLRREYGDDYSNTNSSSSHADSGNQHDNPHDLAYINGAGIAGALLINEWGIPDVLQTIAEVWIEILCYAARHCSEVAHSKQLSNGGELMSATWLLVEYTGRFNFYPEEYLAAANGSTSAGRTSMADRKTSTRTAGTSMADGHAEVSVDLHVC